jgi:WD40 repeat protein
VLAKTSTNVIHLLDRETGKSRGLLKMDPSGLASVFPWQCSPDSRVAAVETRRWTDGRLVLATELFDLESRERLSTIEDLTTLRFSPDGRYLGGKDSKQHPVVWDLQRRRRQPLAGSPAKSTSVAFSRNGLFAASVGSEIEIWEVATGRHRATLKGHNAGVGEIMFSRDDRTLFSTSTERKLKLWNVASGREVLSVNRAEDSWELALSPDDTTLAVGGTEVQKQPVVLWHAPSLKEIDASNPQAPR